MKTLNTPALFFAGTTIALSISLAYVLYQQWWPLTHPKQIQAVQADYEHYTGSWEMGKKE